MVLIVAMFLLTLVGVTLYLYVAGAFHTIHLRPFRFAAYVLLLLVAMTVGIGLIQHSSDGCCPPLQEK
ncbi:MAG: hypothetical protein ABI980_11895 [Nitrospirota bacterium]